MPKVLLFLILLAAQATNATALTITFRPAGAVDDPVIRLGDIADFDEDSELQRALASQIVGQTAAPGEKVVLRSLSVKAQLEAGQPLPADLHWQGAPAVTVLRNGETVGPERIATIIADYIRDNQANLPEAEIRFVPSALPLPFVLPTGRLTHEVVPSNPAILGSSRFSIIFRVDGKVEKNMSVRGSVEALANVVVTAQPLQRGEILRPEQLATSLMDVSTLSEPAFDPRQFVGQRLTRTLRAGVPLLKSMVEQLPIVHRGEQVRMVVQSGPLQVTATGIAASDGALDQMIRVQNISSNKLIYCRVIAAGLVEVML